MEEREIFVQNLCLELTRQCNLSCGHCMRGEMQNHVMSDQTIQCVFEDVNGVGCLQFLGGEISLATDRLFKVVEEIKKHQTKVRSAIVFTNGTNVRQNFVWALRYLRDYIVASNKKDGVRVSGMALNDDIKGILARLDERIFPLKIYVSLDKYHLKSIDENSSRQVVKQNIERLANFFPVEVDKICNFSIFNEGRAKNLKNCYKCKLLPDQYFSVLYRRSDTEEKGVMIGPVLSLSYDGRFIEENRNYDYSDAHGVGNINEESFYDMLKKLQREKGVKIVGSIDKMYQKFHEVSHKNANTTTKQLRKAVRLAESRGQKLDFSYLCSQEPVSLEELNVPEPKSDTAINLGKGKE